MYAKAEKFAVQVLSDISKSKTILATSVQFVDIAGLVKGASKGEGLGNQFLANIRECDAITQVSCTLQASDMNFVHFTGATWYGKTGLYCATIK